MALQPMQRIIIVIAVIGALVLIAGCAAVTGGNNDSVTELGPFLLKIATLQLIQSTFLL